jgi:hypothetical protein
MGSMYHPGWSRAMQYFGKPVVAIGFGAFFLCAGTCLHGEEILHFAGQPFALPWYDWSAGGLLLGAGVLTQRAWTFTRRQYQAVAWAFMVSLLFGALISAVEEWLTAPNTVEWGISEGGFVAIISVMILIGVSGVVGTIRTPPSADD